MLSSVELWTSKLKNTADQDACYMSKVWSFVFIWAGLVWQYSSVKTKYNKSRFEVMANYLHM